MLRLVLKLFVLYNVPISKQLAALCWIWYSYYNYIKRITWCKIFWWFYWSVNLSSCHFSCFFGQAWPPFCGSNYFSNIFWVLGIDHFYICHLFLVGWSFYSCRCNSTCWDRHFFVLNGIMRCSSHVTLRCLFSCPTFWKLSGLAIPLIAGFFGGLLTQAKVYFPFSKHSSKYHTSTPLLLCGSKGRHLVINSSHHTNILFIINSFSYSITYLFWLAIFYNDPPFTMLMWSYHWQSRYPFVLMSFWEWMYNIPWHILGYYYNYCFREWNTCLEGGLAPFPLPHSTSNGYSYYYKWFPYFDGHYHC